MGVLTVACTAAADLSTTSSSSTTTATSAPTTTTTTLPDCSSEGADPPAEVGGDTAAAIAIAVSALRYDCANEVIVTADTLAAIRAGAALGASDDLPVLVNGEGVTEEIARLGARSVHWVGSAPAPEFGLETEVIPPGDVIEPRPEPSTTSEVTWVLGSDPDAAPILEAAAASRGEGFIDITAIGDLRTADPETLRRLQVPDAVSVGLDEDQQWQLEVVRQGTELPGGGFTFDDKRLVAFYGNPTTSALGVLGEQDPAGTLDRLGPLVTEYTTEEYTGVPTFEIIATVASARAGADNDYSDEAGAETLRPWIDFAAENGVYVILDLQPGRTDFLTQAQRYEEFLRLPHVGLALDPEWRLEPDQVHLRQIGSVDAAEINLVSEWLAQIVREEGLAQKYFLVHQFRFSMITDRERIQTPPELFTVIQMDGQGPLPTKYETYSAITAGQEDVGWAWGWKNFYDEDSPMATPEEVLAVEPVVVFVSFQ